MPITTLNLPVPAADGSGAWVDVSSIGPERTISIDVGANFEGELFVDAACTAGAAPIDPAQFTPVVRFDSTTQRKTTILLACNFLRVRRRFTRPENPTVPVVNVGGDAAGASVFGVLAVTAGDGLGAPFDISAGGEVLTVLTAGNFDRAAYIEGSQDAGATFARIEDFGKFEAAQGKTAICIFERIRVASEKSRSGDSPIVMVGCMALASLGSGGITSINANGGAAQVGPAISLLSPMLSRPAANTFRHDNANDKTLPDPFVSGDIDTDVNNGFIVPKLSANLVVPIPTNTRSGRKITFKITQEGTTRTVTWTGGAGGYQFVKSGSSLGPTQAQFDAELAAMLDDEILKIGFEFDSAKNRWLCVALTGRYA